MRGQPLRPFGRAGTSSGGPQLTEADRAGSAGKEGTHPASKIRFGGALSTKITAVVVAVTFAALVIAAAGLLHFEAGNHYQNELRVQKALAEVVGKASAAAITFDDVRVGANTLALLKDHESVMAAALYRRDGSLFASFVRDERGDSYISRNAAEARSQSSSSFLEVLQPISDESEDVGSIYIRARYAFYDRLWNYAAVLSAVMLVSFAVAGLLTLWLRRFVMRPIDDLTRAAKDVIARRDFSVRVRRMSTDEVGHLVDAFNLMLHEVGSRTSALEQSEARLVEADRRKDEFLATLAHELRNPLAPLLTSVELFRLANVEHEVVRRTVPMMERQIVQMTRLVNDLLDVARITSGKLALDCSIVDLRDVVSDAMEIVQPLVSERAGDLHLSVPDEPLLLYGDAVRLAQVLSNLLNNALKFTPRGRAVRLSVVSFDQHIVITVSDEGIGIAPDMLERIFGMFTQGPAASGMRAGLGVGLALTRQLVMLHGGNIAARSAGAGTGSEFEVSLPRRSVAARHVAPGPAREQLRDSPEEATGAGPKRAQSVETTLFIGSTDEEH